MPGPKRTDVTEQFDELDPQTKRYLGDTDVDAPASKSADLFRNAGADGRRALNDLAQTDRRAADALLEIDDAATQRRFVRAHEQGEVSTDELSTAVRRYDDMDAEGTEFADDVIAQSGDDGADLLSTDVCNSPCHGTIRSVYEYTKQSDGLDDEEAKDLLKAYDQAEDVTTGPGSNGPGEVQEAVNALDQRDVEGIRDVMRHTQGNERGYKEIAGETDVANKLLEGDNGIEAGDIEMQRQIRDVDNAPNTKSDVDVDSELTVNGRTLESPAIESKHLSVGDKSDFIIRQESRDLKNKLMTQAADGEDELVIVTTDEYLDRMREQEMLGEIRKRRPPAEFGCDGRVYNVRGLGGVVCRTGPLSPRSTNSIRPPTSSIRLSTPVRPRASTSSAS